jgi:hypothetical protein
MPIINRCFSSVLAILAVVACGSNSGNGSESESESESEPNPKAIGAESKEYVVFAWNDLGMHCLNPSYDTAVILPPYNNLVAQVIERGDPPRIVTTGIDVSYRLIDNTTSMGKTDDYGGDFSQFWTNAPKLFGTTLANDTGLNLVEPSRHNGLSGTMVPSSDHFEANGVPVVPVLDNGTWDPFQVAEVVVKDSSGKELIKTQATVPTSDEINCAKCHDKNGEATEEIGGGTSNVFENILALHDDSNGTSLLTETPVLCASCHGSPALGQSGPGTDGYLSKVIHSKHAEEAEGITCYNCHPGNTTKCSRSKAHTANDGNCTTCHGSLAEVGSSIAKGNRIPWVNEPTCVTCHEGVAQVDTGSTLYRHSNGHGGVYCAACHGSPHAMIPSEQPKDEYQAKQYQTVALPIGSCAVCHDNSRGGGASEFGEEHGGSQGRASACRVCHTVTPTSIQSGPHHFEWKAR